MTTISAKLNWMAYSELPWRPFLGRGIRSGVELYWEEVTFFITFTNVFLNFCYIFNVFKNFIWTFLHLWTKPEYPIFCDFRIQRLFKDLSRTTMDCIFCKIDISDFRHILSYTKFNFATDMISDCKYYSVIVIGNNSRGQPWLEGGVLEVCEQTPSTTSQQIIFHDFQGLEFAAFEFLLSRTWGYHV